MTCPKCGSSNITVVDTMYGCRNDIFRRKKCRDCESRFRTVEVVMRDTPTFNNRYLAALEQKSKLYRATNNARRALRKDVTND